MMGNKNLEGVESIRKNARMEVSKMQQISSSQ